MFPSRPRPGMLPPCYRPQPNEHELAKRRGAGTVRNQLLVVRLISASSGASYLRTGGSGVRQPGESASRSRASARDERAQPASTPPWRRTPARAAPQGRGVQRRVISPGALVLKTISSLLTCLRAVRRVRSHSCGRRLARLLQSSRRLGDTRLLLFLHLNKRQSGVAGNDFEDGVG